MNSTDDLQRTLADAIQKRAPEPDAPDTPHLWRGKARALCRACPRLVLADGTCYRELHGRCPA